MKQQTLALSLSLSLLSIAIAVVVVDAAFVGGWTPIKDLKDKHVIKIAEFAVRAHNNQTETKLKLDSIVKGELQVVDGRNYRLLLAVKGGRSDNKYRAVVYEATDKVKTLISFVPSRS